MQSAFKTTLIAAAAQSVFVNAFETNFLDEPTSFVEDEPVTVDATPIDDTKNSRKFVGEGLNLKVNLFVKTPKKDSKDEFTFTPFTANVVSGGSQPGISQKSKTDDKEAAGVICFLEDPTSCTEETFKWTNTQDAKLEAPEYNWQFGPEDNFMTSLIANKVFAKNIVAVDSEAKGYVFGEFTADQNKALIKDSFVYTEDKFDAKSSVATQKAVVMVGEAQINEAEKPIEVQNLPFLVENVTMESANFDKVTAEIKKVVKEVAIDEKTKAVTGPCDAKYPSVHFHLDSKVQLQADAADFVVPKTDEKATACALRLASGDVNSFGQLPGYVFQYNFSDNKQGFALSASSKKPAVKIAGAIAGLQTIGSLALAAATLLAW